MVAHEVGAHGVDIRDQLVRIAGAGKHPGSRDAFRDFVNIGRPGNAGIDAFVDDKRRRRFKRGCRIAHLYVRRPESGGKKKRGQVIFARRILRERYGFPAQVPRGLDAFSHHNSIAAVGPVYLLQDTGRRSRILDQFRGQEDHHVYSTPERMHLAGRKCITGGNGIIHQHHFDPETVFFIKNAFGVGPGAAIGGNDREPARPDVVAEAEYFLLFIPLVPADAFDGRQPIRRDIFIFLYGRNTGGIGSFRFQSLGTGSAPRSFSAGAALHYDIRSKADQTDYQRYGQNFPQRR